MDKWLPTTVVVGFAVAVLGGDGDGHYAAVDGMMTMKGCRLALAFPNRMSFR